MKIFKKKEKTICISQAEYDKLLFAVCKNYASWKVFVEDMYNLSYKPGVRDHNEACIEHYIYTQEHIIPELVEEARQLRNMVGELERH